MVSFGSTGRGAQLVAASRISGNRLSIAALLPLDQGDFYFTARMVQAATNTFEQDANQNQNVLPGHTVPVMIGNSGTEDEPHEALGAVSNLRSEAKIRSGTIVGWLGPGASEPCAVTQTYSRAQPAPGELWVP